MILTIDDDCCIRCGACVLTCPDLFQMIDGSVKILESNEVPEGLKAATQQVVEDCPVEAITIA